MRWHLVVFMCFFFFFNDPATTEIYPLSLHDALPICRPPARCRPRGCRGSRCRTPCPSPASPPAAPGRPARSEEHTSELQSRQYLVCRLLLEKKKKKITKQHMFQQTYDIQILIQHIVS